MSNEHRDDREALEFLRRGHPWKGFALAAMTRIPWRTIALLAAFAAAPHLPSSAVTKIASAVSAPK